MQDADFASSAIELVVRELTEVASSGAGLSSCLYPFLLFFLLCKI